VNTVIRTPVLHGFQAVSALLLAADQRSWILAHWHLGFRLQRVQSQHWQGFLLIFPAPMRCDTATLPGLALIADQGRLYGAQAAPKWLGSEPILLCQGGVWVAIAESELSAVDAADWLDLSAYPCLRAPTMAIAPLQKAALSASASSDARAILGGKLAKADPALLAFLKAREQGAQDAASGAATGSKWLALMNISASMLASAFAWFTSHGNTNAHANAPNSAQGGNSQSGAALVKKGGGWWQRIASLIGVGKLMGLQHAAFLARMLRDLDAGNIEELLKRAIPLGDANGLGEPLTKLGFLQPRSGLSWTHQSQFGIGVGVEFMEQLAQRYRQLFRQLDRAGRIEEAAFVLIELLRETDEGIEYLLKHGEFRKAAELAEARAQPPARVVRLWLLAGERARAFRLARWSKCYPAALQMLADQPELVHVLRREWAENLAAAHQYPEAVQALWPLSAERARCLRWIEAAKATESQRAAMLCCELQLEPERLPLLHDELTALLSDSSENAAEQREVMARTLLRERVNAATQRLLVPLMRALLSDMSSGRLSPDAALIQQLEKHASEPFWHADRARGTFSQVRVDLLARTELLRLELGARNEMHEPTQHVFDAIQLAQGRCLVALGDAGVVLVDHSGRRLHYFKTPAHKLIADRAGGCA
jgi:hypothetical protein